MEPHVNYEMVNSSKYKKKLEEIAKESIKNDPNLTVLHK